MKDLRKRGTNSKMGRHRQEGRRIELGQKEPEIGSREE